MENDSVIRLRLPSAVAGEWKKQARREGLTLSDWIREKCICGDLHSIAGKLDEVAERLPPKVAAPVRETVEKVKKAANDVVRCRHGRTEGGYCGFCHGPAKVR